MKKLFIIGAGGFGREVLELALEVEKRQEEWRVEGFLNSEQYMHDLDNLDSHGYRILESLESHVVTDDNLYVFAIADVNVKQQICNDMLERGAKFINLIHPTAYLSSAAEVGFGLIMQAYTMIAPNTVIGNFVALNTFANVGHDAHIGDYCMLGPGSSVLGYTVIGDSVTLGCNAHICPHVKVGNHAIVGIGSIVVRKVKENATVFGNPAVRIK